MTVRNVPAQPTGPEGHRVPPDPRKAAHPSVRAASGPTATVPTAYLIATRESLRRARRTARVALGVLAATLAASSLALVLLAGALSDQAGRLAPTPDRVVPCPSEDACDLDYRVDPTTGEGAWHVSPPRPVLEPTP